MRSDIGSRQDIGAASHASAGSSFLRGAGAYWLVAFLIVVFGLAGILVRTLVQSREIDWQRASQSAQSLARALESEILSTIRAVDFSLQGVAEKIDQPQILDALPPLRQALLFDRSAIVPGLTSTLVLGENGDLRFSSRAFEPVATGFADREYYKFHAADPSNALRIGRPVVGRTSGTEVLSLSRRLSHRDGSFAGVVVASLQLDYFKRLFRDTALGEGSNITLSKTDGTILMRWPFEPAVIGADASRADLFRHLQTAKSGEFEADTVVDGVRRLIAYRQIADLPLVIGVGEPTRVIFAQWRKDATLTLLVLAGFCALALVLAVLLYRELSRRVRAEASLAELAMTDALTGLHNRRFFDQMMEREWQRRSRDNRLLALAMIDVDHFKTINDSFGHRQGDLALQCVAAAIRETLRPGMDAGARYGGDEFALLIADASADEAFQRIAAMQEALQRICKAEGVATPQLSVGIAALTPTIERSEEDLLRAADAALYEAKERGRNQIVLARTDLVATLQPYSQPMPEAA